MSIGTYGRFTVYDLAGYPVSQAFSNSAGDFTVETTGPPISASPLEEAILTVDNSVLRDLAWHFDIAVVTSTLQVFGAVPIADITSEIPSDAIITSVVQRAQFNVVAVGAPTDTSGGIVDVSGPTGADGALFVGTYSNIFVIAQELIPSGTRSRDFLLSDPIRKWQLIFRPGYGWGTLPDGITGTLGVTCTAAVDYTVTYTTPPPPAAPSQFSITPDTGTTGGGTPTVVTGADFVATPSVTFDGIPAASVGFVDSATLDVVTPAHAAGAVDVVVTNPDAQVCTLPLAFTYVGPPPNTVSLDQLVVELVYDAAIATAVIVDDDDGWNTIPGIGGGGIPSGPGECAGVGYGIGFLGGPGGTAGTGDPMSTVAIDLKQFFGGVNPPALGFLYAYAAGSLTPQDTFANSSLATANVWPIQLDADGNSPTPVFLGPFIYKFDLQDSDHVSLAGYPKDNIAGSVWPGQVLGAVTVNPIANADGIGHSFSSTLNKAASGTHALFAGVRILAPTIGAGAASLTEAATFSIAGPPLGGTTRYVFHIEQGDVLLTDSASKLGFYGHAVVAQQLLATGAGHTVDDVITCLQALGLVKQA